MFFQVRVKQLRRFLDKEVCVNGRPLQRIAFYCLHGLDIKVGLKDKPRLPLPLREMSNVSLIYPHVCKQAFTLKPAIPET